MKKTLVMKFGGAAAATPSHFFRIADIIIQRKTLFPRIAVVVSAMGNTTDELISLAKQINPYPPQREYDMLVTVGERISIALLAMALATKNQEGVSFTGSQSGIITCNRHAEARIIDVKPHRLIPLLDQEKLVIVAGFQGVSRQGEITTLGRGGSDTTAVALAVALGAEKVEFFKDVPGIFSEDPKKNPQSNLFTTLTHQQALEIVRKGAKVLHPRCIELAEKNGLPLWVRSFQAENRHPGTCISDMNLTRPSNPLYEEQEREG
jgi:aspartate kinase